MDTRIDQSIVLSEGKYFVSLPKRDDEVLLGSNFQNAKNRLLSLEKRFKKNPDLKEVILLL